MPSSRRIASIDTMRVAANFFLIVSHWFSWYGPDGPDLYVFFYYFLGNLANFTVAFFFTVSGYFIRRSLESGTPGHEVVRRYAIRILPIFIFWTAVYALVPGLGLRTLLSSGWGPMGANLREFGAAAAADPLGFLMTGHETHLWFLPSLVLGCAWLVFWTGVKKESWIAPLGIAAYTVYLATGPYSQALGITKWPVEISRGLLCPIGCMGLGYFACLKKQMPSLKMACFLALAGYALKFGETFALLAVTGDPVRQAFMAGTPWMALGLFFAALQAPRLLERPALSRFASLTLGIYAGHLLLDRKAHQLAIFQHGTWTEFFAPFAIYAATLAAVYAMSLVPGLRRFVKSG